VKLGDVIQAERTGRLALNVNVILVAHFKRGLFFKCGADVRQIPEQKHDQRERKTAGADPYPIMVSKHRRNKDPIEHANKMMAQSLMRGLIVPIVGVFVKLD